MANWYVDFSAAYHGDGSTYTQAASGSAAGAFNTLFGISPASGDFVWVRRAGALALAAAFTASWPGVHVVGWPVSGDSYYASRPSGAQASWDADTSNSSNGQYWAKLTTSSNANNFAPTGTGLTLHRLWVDSSVTSNGSPAVGTFTGAACVHENLQFTYSGAVNGTGTQLKCYSNTGATPRVTGLYCKGSSSVASGSAICSINSGASDGFVANVSVDVAYMARGSFSSSTSGAIVLGNTSGNKSLVACNLSVTQLATAAEHQGSALVLASGSVHVNGMTVNGGVATAYEGPGVYVASSDSRVLGLVGNNNVGCLFNAGSSNLVEALKWGVGYPMVVGGVAYTSGGVTSPVVVSSATSCNGNTFILHNATLTTSNTQNKLALLGGGNVVLLDYTDFVAGSVYRTGANSQSDYEIFSSNHGKILGAFHYENRHGTVDATNTYRSGGGAFALKCQATEPNYGQNRWAIPISPKGREALTVNLVAGTNTLTLYGAHKSYAAAPTKNDVGFALVYFDNANGFHSVNTMAFDGSALTADSSTWVNDTGLTAFKVSVTLTSCAAQTAYLNLFASPEYDASGYLYLDPAVVVS